MPKQNKKKRLWIQNLLNRYRVVVISESTFEERFLTRISQLRIILLLTFFVLFIVIGSVLMVAYTPLKEFIPGYTTTALRKEAIRNSFLLDSLTVEFQKQERFIHSISKALIGEFDQQDATLENNTVEGQWVLNPQKLTTADSLLRLEVSQEDKYNVIPNTDAGVKYLLYPPALGIVSSPFDPKTKHFAVDIALEKNSPIMAVAAGTVIFSEWTADTGYVIIVKHEYGLLSAYKHNASLEKSQGDLVSAGEVIARAGNTGELTTGWHLHFELWINGYPVDPSHFIDFSEAL
ncbi:MAG: M23 family metallopeptidase [Flavobacteriia bacterium]|nr:M23 family metallopeptidase [Flavobacteriia bacterium]